MGTDTDVRTLIAFSLLDLIKTMVNRTYALGVFAGPIYVVILIVDIAFFALLEWLIPRDQIDYVPKECDWTQGNFERYAKVYILWLAGGEIWLS